MVNKNELKKNISTAALIFFASTVFATAPINRVYAQEPVVQNIEALTPVETEQWSSAKVYANARYGQTWSGSNAWETQTRWEWLNDMNYVFTAENVKTYNGTLLNYQWLCPIDMTQSGPNDTYFSHTDNNEPIRKWFMVHSAGFPDEGETLQNSMASLMGWYQLSEHYSNVGLEHLDYQEDALTCRFTFNVTKVNPAYGTTEHGYVTFVQNRKTEELYQAEYFEQEGYYDSTRALTVIYSFLPL